MFRFKKISVVLLFILILSSLVFPAFADTLKGNDETVMWFDSSNGYVRDGSVGDKPGVIGDEYVKSPYKSGNMNDMSPDMTEDGYYTAEQRVAGDTDSTDDGTSAFWGVVVALAVGAAAILIAVFALPAASRRER